METIPVMLDGHVVDVQVDVNEGSEDVSVFGGANRALFDASESFHNTVSALISATLNSFEGLGESMRRPSGCDVEFGLKISGEGSFVVAKASMEASIKITVKYVFDKSAPGTDG